MAFLFSKAIQFLLLSCMVSILHTHSNAQIFTSDCTPLNTINTNFQNNLNLLLNSLSSNVARTNFYNTSTGENPDRVYGLAQCVLHLTPTACVDCINTSIQYLHQNCPASTGGIVLRDDCILRYSNISFFSLLDNSTEFHRLDGKNVSDPVELTPFLKGMMSNLSRRAAFDSSSSMFVAGDAAFTSNETVHGMVQCTRDLSGNDCNECLQDVIEETLRCCSFSQSVDFFHTSCNLQYDVNDSDASSGGPPSPSSSTTTAKPIQFEVFVLLMFWIWC